MDSDESTRRISQLENQVHALLQEKRRLEDQLEAVRNPPAQYVAYVPELRWERVKLARRWDDV
jgi:hypothetical protein